MIHLKGDKYESIWAQKHSWYFQMPLISPHAAAESYLQTKNFSVGTLISISGPLLWIPQFGIVLCVAEETNLLAILGGFLFLYCNRKYFVWDLFSSTTEL